MSAIFASTPFKQHLSRRARNRGTRKSPPTPACSVRARRCRPAATGTTASNASTGATAGTSERPRTRLRANRSLQEDAAAAEKPAAPAPKKPAAQRSVTDARAEFPLPQARRAGHQAAATPRRRCASRRAARRASRARPSPRAGPIRVASPPARRRRPRRRAASRNQPQPQPSPRPHSPAAGRCRSAAAAARRRAVLRLPRHPPRRQAAVDADAADRAGRRIVGHRRDGQRHVRARQIARQEIAPEAPPVAERTDAAAATRPKSRFPSNNAVPEEPRAPDDPNRRLQQMLAEIQKRAAA